MNRIASAAPPDIGNSSRHIQDSQRDWSALIVSASLENRKALLRILEGLSVNVFIASTIAHAQEVLAQAPVEVIFCEESLPDGSYRHILEPLVATRQQTRFVVMLCAGEWEEYIEAMRFGTTDVLRYPVQASEVNLILTPPDSAQSRLRFDVMA